MGLAGGMALQEAAPANAVVLLAPLAPVIGSAIGGTGITAGGWALLAGGAAALTAAVSWSTPDANGDTGLDRAIDWLMEPVDILGRPLDANGNEVDDAKIVPDKPKEEDVINCDATGLCPEAPWVNQDASFWAQDGIKTVRETPTGCISTQCTTNRRIQVQFYLPKNPTTSGGSHSLYQIARMTCQLNDTSGAVVEHVAPVRLGSYSASMSAGQYVTGHVQCPRELGNIRSVVLEPATRKQVCEDIGCTDRSRYLTGAIPNSLTYTAFVNPMLPVDKKIRTTVVCRDSAGVETTITADSPVSEPSMTVPSCASRGLGEAVSVSSDFYDGDILKKNIFNGETGAGAGQKLAVHVDGQECVVGWNVCEVWAGLSVTAPDRVKCFLGGAEVALSQCGYLEGAYLVGGSPATKTNVDGNPATWTPPSTVPGWVPHKETDKGPVADPTITPSPDPNPSPDPALQPGPKPSPSPSPSTSPSPSPGTGTESGGFPSSGTNPGGVEGPLGENCFGAKWSWNPIDWVVTPVACALEWAFVPSEQVVNATIATTRPTITQKGIAPVVDVIMVTADALPDGGPGCAGPGIDLSVLHQKEMWHPFSACTAPMDGVAFIVRTIFSLVIVFAGCFSVVNALGRAFGYTIPDGAAKLDT